MLRIFRFIKAFFYTFFSSYGKSMIYCLFQEVFAFLSTKLKQKTIFHEKVVFDH